MNEEDKYKQKESDLIKEFLYAFFAVLAFILILALLFKSPQMKPLSIESYSKTSPIGFEKVESRNILGISSLEDYGPPYNKNGQAQSVGFISPAGIEGVTVSVHPKEVFFIDPLITYSQLSKKVKALMNQYFYLSRYDNSLLNKYEENYYKALNSAKVYKGKVIVKGGEYGPIKGMENDLLTLAQTGVFQNLLDNNLNGNNGVYSYNFQNKLLFLQGAPLANMAKKYSMLGNQWGILKEEGNYPGPWWLFLYTSLYQIPPYSTSPSGDLMAFLTFSIFIAVLFFVPIIPVLNKIPYYIPIYKIIWRRYYNENKVT